MLESRTPATPRGASSALEALARIPTAVSKVMTRDITTLAPDASVFEAVQLFGQCGFRHMLVVSPDGRLAGVLSDRDALRAIARGRAADRTPVSEIMTRDSVVARMDMPLMDAIDVIAFHRIHCLPVVDAADIVRGIVTTTDLLSAFHGFLDRVSLLVPD